MTILSVAPEVVIVVAIVMLLMVDVQWHPGHRWWGVAAAMGLTGATVAVALQWSQYRGDAGASFFSGMIAVDGFGAFAGMVIFPLAGLGLMAAWPLVRSQGGRGAEFVVLTLIAASGAHLMAASANLVMLFIALEVFSLSLYVLAGFTRERADADEAALKYFLLGAVASAIFLYGIALVFAATGTTSISGVGAYLTGNVLLLPQGVLMAGTAMLMVGLAFKVSAAPFHMWAPDVYQGAPGGITGFLASGAKVAGFAALARVLTVALGDRITDWAPAVAVLAATSIVVGTLLALAQTDLKRMLAYSSVAHAGFILTALVAGSSGIPDMWFYVATYSVQVLAAFAVAAVVSGPTEGRAPLSDYAGLSTRSPWLAAVLGLLMLAMGGIPLTAGFVGKVAVFRSAIDADYLWLVIVGVIASVAGLFFYLRVIVLMYMQPAGEGAGRIGVPAGARVVLAVAATVTVIVGVVPWPLLEWLRNAIPL
ncbi:MAG TPA: NADH-quinone oxidoreductase subunit N [Acidimicrobiia bacterium]|nr:NADH-quinone oxidoreductase subunit N [Acidimicrobiia bacterium]